MTLGGFICTFPYFLGGIMSLIRRLGQLSIVLTCALQFSSSADAFRLNSRWTDTATDPAGLTQGTPTTLTWGFVPDGTAVPNETPSNFIASFDTRFGAGPGGADLTQRPWFTYFEQSFNRWSQLSGLSYIYEPNDDGVTHSTLSGVLGVRADLRIGGTNVDGAGNVLAYNFFPQNGDMILDTGDMANYGQAANNRRFLRNVVMHEHGHGMGLNHLESNNASFLMEPFINTSFDGPQMDDILGAQRHYGDFYEKSNGGAGNNTPANAINFGVIADGGSAQIGLHATTGAGVLATETDFISIDDDSDLDYFRFTVNQASMLNMTLTPAGPTYNEGAQGGSQASLNTAALSNLVLNLYGTDGTTLLQSKNDTLAGSAESIAGFNLTAAGTYYARVSGINNNVQMYTLNIGITATSLEGDFNSDGLYDCADVDGLVAAIVSASNPASFDLNADAVVNGDDLTEWRAIAGAANLPSQNPYLPGDINLDGSVDGSDFNIWNANKFTSVAAWCSGDLTADGSIDGSDFNVWNAFKFQSSDSGTSVVPEPSSFAMIASILALFGVRRRN